MKMDMKELNSSKNEKHSNRLKDTEEMFKSDSQEQEKTFKEILKDLVESSSLHGVPKIISSRQLAVKALWGLLFLGTFSVLVMQLSGLFQTFYSHPIQTTVALEFNSINFPAISICNMNPVKNSKLNMSKALQNILTNNKNSTTRKKRSANRETAVNGNDPKVDTSLKKAATKPEDYKLRRELDEDIANLIHPTPVADIKDSLNRKPEHIHYGLHDKNVLQPEHTMSYLDSDKQPIPAFLNRGVRRRKREVILSSDISASLMSSEESSLPFPSASVVSPLASSAPLPSETVASLLTSSVPLPSESVSSLLTNSVPLPSESVSSLLTNSVPLPSESVSSLLTNSVPLPSESVAYLLTSSVPLPSESVAPSLESSAESSWSSSTDSWQSWYDSSYSSSYYYDYEWWLSWNYYNSYSSYDYYSYNYNYQNNWNEWADPNAYLYSQLSSKKDLWDERVQLFKTVFKNESIENRRLMGHQKEDLIMSASFAGTLENVTKFQNFTSAQYGNCYTVSSPRYVAWRSGPSHGLKMTLNLEIDEYVSNFSTGYGIRLVLHEPGTYPLPTNEGLTLGPGTETNIGLKMVRISRLGQPYGDCVKGQEFAKRYKKKYSTSACYEFCRIIKTIEVCKCVPTDAPDEISLNSTALPVCNTSVVSEKICLLNIDIGFNNGNYECDCHGPCKEIVFEKTMSSRYWPTRDYMNVLLSEVCEKNSSKDTTFLNNVCDNIDTLSYEEYEKYRNNFLRVIIYFEDLNYETISQEPMYESVRFLSDIGGAMGLFLGASVLSLVEFLQLLMEIVLFIWGRVVSNKTTRVQVLRN